MQRLNRVRLFAIAFGIVGIAHAGAVVQTALAQGVRAPESQSVRLIRGSITGVVSDERGGPVAGAIVSAFGQTMAVAVTDSRGVFSMESLPFGEYILQAHLTGFAGSPRESVRVGTSVPVQPRLQI